MEFGGLVFTMPEDQSIAKVKERHDAAVAEREALYAELKLASDLTDIDRLITELSAACEKQMVLAKIYNRLTLLEPK